MNINRYDVVFCDIDDTLIHGFWTDIMRVTWSLFSNRHLSRFLMRMQYYFKTYKVNERLRYLLQNYKGHLIFLSAREYVKETKLMLDEIMTTNNATKHFEYVALATDNPEIDKNVYIDLCINTTEDKETKVCLIDDNKTVRYIAGGDFNIDAYDPMSFLEKEVL